jgi:hypothetical protein
MQNHKDIITPCPLRRVNLKILTGPNANENVKQVEESCITSRYVKWYNHFIKPFKSFLVMANLHLTQQLYLVAQEKMKVYVHHKTCNEIFIAPLFIVANKWKQTKCSLVKR